MSRNADSPTHRARRRLAGEVAGVTRHHGADDPRLPEMRRDLAVLRIEEQLEELPGITPEQQARLVARLVERTRAAQGLPPKIEDAATLARIASLADA